MARILFVLNSASGGAAVSARDLMGELKTLGHRCYAVLPPGGSARELAALEACTEARAFLPLPWWNRKYKAIWWKRPLHWARQLVLSGAHVLTLIRLRRWAAEWRIELIHTNTSLNLQGALVARWLGLPHVWHIREQIGRRSLFRFWLPERALARTFVGLSRAVLVNSEESRALFARQGLRDAVRVAYNGVRVEDFAAPERGEALRAALGIEPGTLVVAMVGHLTSRVKRHDTFVEAVAILAPRRPGVRFVVVGSDPERTGGYRSELDYATGVKTLARRLGVEERILWTGAQDDVPAVMNALDVLVHPADRESFGRVAVEAMAAGRPVVAADSGGLREIVEHERTGLRVPAGDAEGFAAAIARLLDDDELRRSLGQEGARVAAEHFSLATTARQVDAAYREILGGDAA